MVGSNFLEHRAAGGYEILSPSRAELDLLDYGAVCSVIEEFRPDVVVHAAGKVGGIEANIREPVRFLLDNLDMGRNVVWAAHNAGIKCLINLGSSCMYPRDVATPFCEAFVLKGELEPTNEGYALAKVVVARLCQYISREFPDSKYKTLIPCNIYGRHDKFDPEESHLVAAIIYKLHKAKVTSAPYVDIWGDGSAKREFMYAGDLADLIWRTILNLETLPDIMNVGVGRDFTVKEYYEAAARVVGYTGGFKHDLNKPVGMGKKLLNIERSLAWGWQAKTSLEQGLEKTYKYYLEQFNHECA